MKIQEPTERGVSAVIVAAGLTAFLGFLAVVLDLGMLYAARSDAQKAADAASLAGAKYFLSQGSLPTALTQSMRDAAKAYAKAIGSQNAIRGASVQPSEIVINDSDIQLVSSTPPVFQVTSRVQRTGLSTYFATIFGVNAVDVAATAVARASKAAGSSLSPTSFNVGAKCLKPLVVQDLSPDGDAYGEADLGNPLILNPDPDRNVNGGPGKWGMIALDQTLAPPPALGTGDPAEFYTNIVQCNPNTYYCAADVMMVSVSPDPTVTRDRIKELIHMVSGPDVVVTTGVGTPSFDFTITGGAGNPNPALQGQTITQSNSIVIVALTAANPLPTPGAAVNIAGFLKLFIEQLDLVTGDINTRILGVEHCAPAGSGHPNVSSTSGGIDILRLVR